jgi:hypothetical protein
MSGRGGLACTRDVPDGFDEDVFTAARPIPGR